MKYYEVHFIFKGKRQKKLLQASNKIDALTIAKLKNPGVIVKITQASTPIEKQLINFYEKLSLSIFKQKVKMPDLIASIRQLSVMTNAGISIHNSIKEVIKATTNKHLKTIFKQIDDDLNVGNSLAEAILPFKNSLGEVTIAMVELGENTGDMGSALSKLADIQEDIWNNKQKFKKAIRYPITVAIAIVIAFIILMIYVVPKFKSIFDKFKTELPLPTRILLNIEYAFSNYGLYILSLIIIFVIFSHYMYTNNDNSKKWVDVNIFKVYLIGKIIFYSSMSRFNLIFTELIKAGIPITKSLDASILTLNNIHLKHKLQNVKVSVQRGASLTDAFKDTKLYESMLIQMICAGEQSGNLSYMLEKVTDYYKSKFDNIIDNITNYIEPILIGFIAIIVLLMALGIFMPMWDLAKAVKN